MGKSIDFFDMIQTAKGLLLSCIVTGNKTWVWIHMHTMGTLNQNNNPWHGGRHASTPVKKKNSSQRFPLTKPGTQQSFHGKNGFCLQTSCLKAPQSTPMSIAKCLRNCIVRSKVSDVDPYPGPVSYTHLDVYKRQHTYLHTQRNAFNVV